MNFVQPYGFVHQRGASSLIGTFGMPYTVADELNTMCRTSNSFMHSKSVRFASRLLR